MQIVIDISDKAYGLLKYFEKSLGLIEKENDTVETAIMRAVINGTPLPKGHGRLIDADMVCDELEGKSFSTSSDYHNAIDAVDDAPTIIEADKEGDAE